MKHAVICAYKGETDTYLLDIYADRKTAEAAVAWQGQGGFGRDEYQVALPAQERGVFVSVTTSARFTPLRGALTEEAFARKIHSIWGDADVL